MQGRVQPNELNPLAWIAGSKIKVEDVVLSSATFLMWERLYGVTTVSTTTERMMLHIVRQRQDNQSSTESHDAKCKLVISPRPAQTASDTLGGFGDKFLPLGSHKKTDSESLNTSPQKLSTATTLPDTLEEISYNGGSSSSITIVSNDRNVQLENRSAPHERFFSSEDVQPRKRSRDGDGDDIDRDKRTFFSHAPPTPITGASSQERKRNHVCVRGNLLSSQSSFQSFAEGVNMQFHAEAEDVASGEAVTIKTVATPNDTWLRGSQMSEVLQLDEDCDVSEEHTDVSSHVLDGRIRSSGSHHPLPDPSRLTDKPLSAQPRLRRLIEAQGTSAKVRSPVTQTLNDEESVWRGHLQEVREREKNEDEPGVSAGYVPIFSDRPQVEILSSHLSWCGGATEMSLSSSPWPPVGSTDEQVVLERHSGPSPVSVETVEKKMRRYRPPPFSTTAVLCNNGMAEEKDETNHLVQASWASSLPQSVQQTCELGLIPRGVEAQYNREEATPEAPVCQTTSVHSESPPLSPFSTSPPNEGCLCSLPDDRAFLFSSFSSSSSSDHVDGYDEQRSSTKKLDSIGDRDGDHTSPSLTRMSGKRSSHSALLHEEELNRHIPQQKEKIGFSTEETNKEALSVSPLPSQKDYQWAEKAQEALEQQYKRCFARTPSTNPPTPPPLQVGGFDLPKMTRCRHPSLETALGEEENKLGAESPQAATGVSYCPHTSPNGILDRAKSSFTRPPGGSLSKSAPPTLSKRARKHQAAVEAPLAAKKLAYQRVAVSPPPTPEFPLPRHVVAGVMTTPPVIQKKKKREK